MAGVACALLCWHSRHETAKRASPLPTGQIAAALSITILILVMPFSISEIGWLGPAAVPGVEEVQGLAKKAGLHSGVILLADAKNEDSVPSPPRLRTTAEATKKATSARTIPFSGEYWYFFWPQRRPSKDSIRKLGSPKTWTYTDVDGGVLVMQGRQSLAKSLDLNCCTAIDVVLDGPESRPETVYVQLILLDSSKSEELSLDLGMQPLPGRFEDETALRFSLSPTPEVSSFNQLVVWFHLAEPRQYRSANLAIDRFELVP